MDNLQQHMQSVPVDWLVRYMRIMVLYLMRCVSNDNRCPLNSDGFLRFIEARNEFCLAYGGDALNDAFEFCDGMDVWFEQEYHPDQAGLSKYDFVRHIIRTAALVLNPAVSD